MQPTKKAITFSAIVLSAWMAAPFVFAAPTLNVGTVSGQAGSNVNVPISFNPTTDAVAGIQFNLTLPVNITTVSVTAGAVATAASKSVSTNLNGTTWTFIVFGLNQNTMGNGALLTAQVRIGAGASIGNLNFAVSNVVYSDPNGASIPAGTSTAGTITVVPPAPSMTSASSTSGTQGSSFNFQLSASNSPTSFGASGLPAGLGINATTGLISGTPTTAGTFNVAVSATNSGGTGNQTLTITLNPLAPVVTSASSATATVGIAFTYQIRGSSNPTSFNAVGLPAGLSVNTTSGLISGTPTLAGVVISTVSATNAGGTGTKSVTITITLSCDMNADGSTNVADVQLSVNQAILIAPCTGDLNGDTFCNVIDVQRVVNAALGGSCITTP